MFLGGCPFSISLYVFLVVFLSGCVLCCTGKLYAVGGYDGASRQCLSTVEEYNPVSNQWGYMADMSTRRSGAGADSPHHQQPSPYHRLAILRV